MFRVPTGFNASLYPLICFLSWIGIDLRPGKRRSRCVGRSIACYVLACMVVCAFTNITFLVLEYEINFPITYSESVVTAVRMFFMFCSFSVQGVGCHFALVWFARFHWTELSHNFIKISLLVGFDGRCFVQLKRLSLFAVAIILSVEFQMQMILDWGWDSILIIVTFPTLLHCCLRFRNLFSLPTLFGRRST